MRRWSIAPGSHVRLVRPLLGWRHSELEHICSEAGLVPAADPSNTDERFERVRVRQGLAELDWLDASSLARAAANLAEADEALDWAAHARMETGCARTFAEGSPIGPAKRPQKSSAGSLHGSFASWRPKANPIFAAVSSITC